jgi:hypothetical protein
MPAKPSKRPAPAAERLARARKDAETAARAADRAARARAAQPPRDPTGEHHVTMAEVARRSGRDVVDLIDIWDERAAIREYEGETDRAAAEREAAAEVVAMFAPEQPRLPWEE